MSAIDLRGFAYDLEPLRQRRRWQLDAVQRRLVRSQAELRTAQRDLEGERAALEAAARGASDRALQRMDPRAHADSLLWLARLRRRIEQCEALCERLRADCRRLGQESLSRQQSLEAVEAHRDEALAEFAQGTQRLQAVEADRDWLARQAQQGTRP